MFSRFFFRSSKPETIAQPGTEALPAQGSFIVDAVLFDMVCLVCAALVILSAIKSYFLLQDGTLVDSIAAVEAAWGKVATDIGYIYIF